MEKAKCRETSNRVSSHYQRLNSAREFFNFTWRRMQHKQTPVKAHNSIQVKMAQGHGVSSHHLMQLSTNKWSYLMLQFPPREFDTLNTVIQFNTASENINFLNPPLNENEPILHVNTTELDKQTHEIILIESKLEKIEKSYRRQNILLYCMCISTTINSIVIFVCLILGTLSFQWFFG